MAPSPTRLTDTQAMQLALDTKEQGLDRAGLPGSSEDKGYEAMAAALETVVALKQV